MFVKKKRQRFSPGATIPITESSLPTAVAVSSQMPLIDEKRLRCGHPPSSGIAEGDGIGLFDRWFLKLRHLLDDDRSDPDILRAKLLALLISV